MYLSLSIGTYMYIRMCMCMYVLYIDTSVSMDFQHVCMHHVQPCMENVLYVIYPGVVIDRQFVTQHNIIYTIEMCLLISCLVLTQLILTKKPVW